MYRLAVDDHKKENGTFICQCYTVNKPEELEPETFEKRVEMHEAILYVERNKCSRPLDWIAANESKDIFSNVLAEIINQREGNVLTWANKVDAKTIEENGMPDIFAALKCFDPEYNNTFKSKRPVTMDVSYNAVIREMDAEELKEALEGIRGNNTPLTSHHIFEIDNNYQQLTGKSLIYP